MSTSERTPAPEPLALLSELAEEHALIEQVLGSLRTFVDERLAGRGVAEDGEAFVDFFVHWAGHYHHAREELVLFQALVNEAELPADKGPIAALKRQHRELFQVLSQLGPLLSLPVLDDADRLQLAQLTRRYTRGLWAHIDAENSVLLPESRARLRRHGVVELPLVAPSSHDRSARDAGRALLSRYPPSVDPGAVRGEGCVICQAYGDGCDGVEREWWTELEWDDFFERAG